MGNNVEKAEERAAFYRDLLVKLMGFGMAVIVVICVAVMAAGETELFSLEDPNQVAKDAAIEKGTPDTNNYQIEFDKAYRAASKSQNCAKIYICLIWGGTICWVVAIVWVWLLYRKICGKKPAMRGGFVFAYCATLVLAQFGLGYFLLDIDKHGWQGFVSLIIKTFSGT